MLKLIECPRDAMQGIHHFIPTALKIEYLQTLLEVGFDTLDCGSFVSSKAIPQLQDTAEVLNAMDLSQTGTRLLVIIANVRGAENACAQEKVSYLGYPFSLSETFQQRNTNRSISAAFEDVQKMQELAIKSAKEMVVYLSMGFGNPYGDTWNAEIVEDWLEKLKKTGIKIFSLADTVGNARTEDIASLFDYLTKKNPDLEIGAHFHSKPGDERQKIEAAYRNGCRRFDMAILGYGGCPMAEDELVGNIATEACLRYFDRQEIETGLNREKLEKARMLASEIFSKYQ